MPMIIGRREFIAALGGSAVWSLAALAQQGEVMRRISVLSGFAVDDPEAQMRIAAFRRGLREQGWSEGHNLQIEYRWAGPDAGRIKAFAAELVATSPSLILAMTSPSVAALRCKLLEAVVVPAREGPVRVPAKGSECVDG